MPDNRLYSDFSEYYDALCAEIDYTEQCAYTLRCHQLFGVHGQNYLDLGCGTGLHLRFFAEQGYTVAGLDLNQAMLDLTQQRCPEAQLLLQPMSSLSVECQFDLITCFLYSIHYSYPLDDFQQTLARVYAALRPGGLFVFDAVDKHHIQNDQGCYSRNTSGAESAEFASRWLHRAGNDFMDLQLQFKIATGSGQRIHQETHKMSAVGLPAVQQMLLDLGFEVMFFERDYSSIRVGGDNTTNALFCCIKPF